MEVVSDSTFGSKRARDDGGSVSEAFLAQEPTSLKKLCSGHENRDESISSIFDTVAEIDELYGKGELDEAQERLVFGVMRSLEEELGVSRPLSLFPSENVNANSASPLDSDNVSNAGDTNCFNERIRYDAPHPSDDDFSYTGEGSLSSIAVSEFLESRDLVAKSSQVLDAEFPVQIGLIHAGSLSFSGKVIPEYVKMGMDIGSLLEASDDELGISFSPSSENSKCGAVLVSQAVPETDNASMESTSDSLDLTSWQYESDWLSGGHFAFDFESDPTSQEWINDALSSLKAGLDPSIRLHSALDAASGACLEPACVSH